MFDNIPLALAQEDAGGMEKQPNIPLDASDQVTEMGEQQDPGTGGRDQGPSSSFPPGMILLLLGAVALMFIMTGGSQRKERKRHKQLLASLTKGSRVVTAGGIIGTVIELRDREILVKVDENTNTRLHFTRESIKSVLEEKSE